MHDLSRSVIYAATNAATLTLYGINEAGALATELIHELLLAASAELLVDDVADLIHANPTLSEGTMEIARAALGRAVHA